MHCAGAQKGDGDKARTLVRAASRGGAPHLVNISVVGADRIPLASGIDRAKRRPLVPVRLPGQAARAVRAGANLAPERAVGRRTWEEFLAERVRR